VRGEDVLFFRKTVFLAFSPVIQCELGGLELGSETTSAARAGDALPTFSYLEFFQKCCKFRASPRLGERFWWTRPAFGLKVIQLVTGSSR
jgi:hypothetical protein